MHAVYLLVFETSLVFDSNVKLLYDPLESRIFHKPRKPSPDVLIVGVVIEFPANVNVVFPVYEEFL